MIDLIPHHEQLSLRYNMSISFWLKLNAWPKQWTHVVAKFSDGQHHEFSLRLKGEEQGRWSFGDGTGAFNALIWSPNKCLKLGRWAHVCCVKRHANTLTLYVNGMAVESTKVKTDFPAAMTQQPISVGGLLGSNNVVDGRVKKLEFRDVALTSFQVQQLFEQVIRQG